MTTGTLIILLRLLHITTGVFWAGAVFFVNGILGPTVTAMGPDGGKVMRGLAERKYFEKIIGAATINILSGLYLVWLDSGGFAKEWFRTRFGMGISTGMLAAIIAYLMGVFLVRPTLQRMSALGGELATATSPEAKQSLMGRMEETRGKLMKLGGIGMVFLLVAVLSMAVSRYL